MVEVAFQQRPGSEQINCCSANAPSGFGYLANWALMQDKGVIVVNWYGASTMKMSIGGTLVSLEQQTNYPAERKIKLFIKPENVTNFTLKLRVPYWSANTTIIVNGDAVRNVKAGTYAAITRS